MATVRNLARERLAAGELALGIGLRQARTVDIAKIMKTCGYDFLFIDTEHNQMSVDDAAQISVAAQDAGITPIARVPGFEHWQASRLLDGGAQGIVFPHVDTAEDAARLASHCLYPPRGKRSIGGGLPQIDFAPIAIGEAAEAINAATIVVVMLETPTAIDNLEAIAAVPGIDVLLIGTNDLCLEMGIPGQVDDPKIFAIYDRLIAACQEHAIYPGMGGIYQPTLMQNYINLGVRFVLCGSDLSLLMAAATERAHAVRAMRGPDGWPH